MTPAEAAKVLAKAALFDNRNIGEGDVLAWCEALSDVDGADALAAVSVHYGHRGERLMPAHVRAIVEAIDAERLAERRRVEAEQRRALPAPDVTDRSAEIRAGIREILPKGDPAKLRGPAWRAENPGSMRDGRPLPPSRFGRDTGVPTEDLGALRCGQCGGAYRESAQSRASHNSVFGHMPLEPSRVSTQDGAR